LKKPPGKGGFHCQERKEHISQNGSATLNITTFMTEIHGINDQEL
jgi:hypothetical protein